MCLVVNHFVFSVCGCVCRSVLEGSGSARFFHSMALLGSQLVVFGGNSHVDLTRSTGTLCYSDDVMSYDIGMS